MGGQRDIGNYTFTLEWTTCRKRCLRHRVSRNSCSVRNYVFYTWCLQENTIQLFVVVLIFIDFLILHNCIMSTHTELELIDLRYTAELTTAISEDWDSMFCYRLSSFSPWPPVRSFCFRQLTQVFAIPSWPDVLFRLPSPLEKNYKIQSNYNMSIRIISILVWCFFFFF